MFFNELIGGKNKKPQTCTMLAGTAEGRSGWCLWPSAATYREGTVLQTATRSVSKCKIPQPQNQVAFFHRVYAIERKNLCVS